ncbi:MAG: CDP-diacylglycerol--serine O-phosphatidyltransferase [Bacteroidota bacterium]
MEPSPPRRRPRRRPRTHGRKQRRFRERLASYRAQRAGRSRRHLSRVAMPSFFTLMNLFSGFLAIIQVAEADFVAACWFIVMAGFFDVLDGMVARMANADSAFGVQLDSLSDVVSFGVAPSFLVYKFALAEAGILGLVVSALPALCGAIRLARFNIHFDGEKKPYFEGLPIPVQAIGIVALILTVEDAASFSRFTPGTLSWLIPIVATLAVLMVSRVRFDAAPKPTIRYIREHRLKSGLYMLGLVLFVTLQQFGLLIVLGAYLAHGVGLGLYRIIQAVLATDPAPDASPDS